MPRKASRVPKKSPWRPPIEIDWKIVDKMALAGSSGAEIAGYLNCHPDTFYNRFKEEKGVGFSEYAPYRKTGGHAMIRLKQMESAMRGSNQMLTILGKEWLGQGRNNESLSPNDNSLGMIQDLLNKLKEKEDEINALKSQADPVLQPSDEEIQHLGGCREIGEDLCLDPQIDGLN